MEPALSWLSSCSSDSFENKINARDISGDPCAQKKTEIELPHTSRLWRHPGRPSDPCCQNWRQEKLSNHKGLRKQTGPSTLEIITTNWIGRASLHFCKRSGSTRKQAGAQGCNPATEEGSQSQDLPGLQISKSGPAWATNQVQGQLGNSVRTSFKVKN